MTREQAFDHYMPDGINDTDQCVEWRGPHNTEGYGVFKARGDHRAHRVSYERAHGPIPSGQLVRHTCDNPPCVNPRHLLLGTDADNNHDMMQRRRNRQPRGEDQGSAKLTTEQVREIRRRYALGGISQQALGNEYGINQRTVSKIVRQSAWKHI